MKKNLLKSVLLALMVLVGGNAWADTGNAVVKATYISGSDADVDTSFGEIAAGEAVLCGYNKIANGKVDIANKGWGVNNIAYLQVDASAFEGTITAATLSVDCQQISARGLNYGVGFNTSAWSDKLTWNTADRSITTMGAVVNGSKTTADKHIEFDIKDAFKDDADKIVTILVYQTAAGGGYVKNPTVTVEYTNAATANYTVKFMCGDLELKDAVTRVGVVGQNAALETGDDAAIVKDGMKYIYTGSDAAEVTIAEDGSTIVTINFREAAVYNYTLFDNFGNAVNAGTGFEGDNVAVGYPRYEIIDGVFYEAPKTNNGQREYRIDIALTEDNATGTITYAAKESVNAVFFTEAENIEGITASSEGNIPVRASNALAAVSDKDITITTLPVGKYIFHVGIFTSKSSYTDLKVNFGIGSRTYAAAFSAVNLNEVASGEYVITEGMPIKYLASSSANTQFDYIWIEKTGEPTEEEIATAEAVEALAAAHNALQAAIDEAKAIDTTDKKGVDALNNAIADAEAALAAENATVESLTAAKEELAKAVKAFEDANKPVIAIANADFSESTPIDNHLCGYGKDMAGNNTTYYGMQDITGWNKVVVSGDDATAAYPNSGVAGAVFAYGSEWQMKGNSKAAPAAGPEGNTGNALGFFAVWGCGGYYYQDVILAAGTYTLTIPMYNQSGTQANESYTGFFVNDSDVKYTVAVNPAVGQWTLQSVTFTLEEETAGQIRLGYKSTGSGSGANAMLFIDGVRLQSELDAAIDAYNIALLAAQTAATDEYVTGVEKNALNEAIAANSNIDFTSLAAVKAATDALNLAVATFNEARAHYVAFANSKALVELNKWIYADAEKKTAVELAMRAVAGSADEAKTMNTALLQAYRAYIESNAIAEGVEGAEIIADKIVNADASDGNNGWTISGNMNNPRNTESWTDANGKDDYMYFDGGNWNANSWDVNFAQDITLEAGKYVLSAIMRASTNVDLKLFAGTDSVKAEVMGSAGNVFDRGWNYSFVTFDVAAEGTVNIGVRGVTSNVHEWMSFADFRLVRIEKPAGPEFEPKYGTLWTEEEGYEVTEEPEPYNYIVLDNKYFKRLVKVGDTLRVSISKVGNIDGARSLIIDKGQLNMLIGNDGEEKTIQYGTTSADFVLDENEVAKLQESADVILKWKNLTLAQVELLEHKADIDPTLLAEAEQLASDATAVAVGKLLAAIEAYKKDGIAETLQNAITQFKTDNADQEADQTAKVATNGWKKFDGSNAGVCATQFAPAITTYDGRTANLAEVYENNGNRTGTIIYQDITGLTNGKYKVGFYGNAFSTSVRDGFECTMEDGATDVAYVFANEEKAYITARIATSTTENDFRQFDVEVTDGVIKLGMGKDTEKSTNWHTMQIYQLTWFTTAKEVYAALKTDMQALIADAKAMTGVNKKEAFETALNKAEAALESNMLNITEFEAEIAALKEAMKAFKLANLVIPEGKYYLIATELEDNNVMAAGNSWGTHGIVNGEGLDLNFIYNYDADNYYIETNIYNGNNHFLGSDLYLDAPAFGWKIEEATTGIGFNIYAMFDGVKKYISVASDGNLTLSETAYAWGFIHESNWVAIMEVALKEALEKATPENPVDATLLLKDANFNRNDHRWEAWTVSEDCTNKNLGGGCSGTNGNGCAESFHSTFTISQTITDAPKGTYELKAQGFYRQDEDAVEDAPVFFINDKTIEVPVKTGSENSMSDASESFTAGLYNCEPILVFVEENGTLTVGVKATGANQWVIFDNFRLTYYGATNTVGITEVNTNVENSVKTIYNLNGQKVEKAKKGLYIINGKKTVVK